ncbi:hypothetical protein CRG98_037451 [Punica granatum]|uniref:Aminotransferase-like plant mobile domain-containing protein n=1 Tax=Punica granatum TaxID=22663 RepID=A0A2I0IDT9_PUNGR|nr:hypothetical protein CRG98_037451 [Punica granatum]
MASGDSFSLASVTRPREGGHSQAALHRRPHACPDKMKFGAAVTFWDPTHAVFNIQGTELAPTIEEYRTLIGRTTVTHGIIEPNFRTTRPVLVSRLLGVQRSSLQAELAYSGDTEIITAKLLRFIDSQARVGFKWRAAWMPPRPAALRCRGFNGVPLTIPEDTARARFEHTWREDQTSVNRQRDIERVLDAWRTMVIERPYFPEHPILEEQDFQATEEYVLRFYRWGPTTHEDSANSPRVEDSGPTGASLTPNRELAQARAELQRREQELARANVALERFKKRARGSPRTP